MLNKLPPIVLTLAGSLLLSLSWPYTGSLTPLIFIALVPLLIVEERFRHKGYRPRKFFLYAYLFFFVFNVWTTWWIYFASAPGMIMAVVFNSLLMTFPMYFFHLTRKRIGSREGYLAFFFNWIGFEYLHYYWELSWPWLSFGNVFALHTEWVQWYEFTGSTGGSLWILAVNMLVFSMVKKIYMLQDSSWKAQKTKLIALVVLLVLPISSSYFIYQNVEDKGNSIDVVIVQPNIDPYNDKFGNLSAEQQMQVFFALAAQKMDQDVDLVVGPETQLPWSIEENDLENEGEIRLLRQFLEAFPGARLVTGMSSHRFLSASETTKTSRETQREGLYIDYFNSALHLSKGEEASIYHKSELVLGVERIPFIGIIPGLEKLALDLGGTSGSLGVQEDASVFKSMVNSREMIIAPAICYESIYGEYMTEFVRLGANLITVITNDGWWDNSPGYRQHLVYSRLRAIENRRNIVRAANTGISAIINQRGDIVQQTEWWTPAAIRGKVQLNQELTYFSRNGDFIGRTAMFVALLLLAYTLSRWLQGKTA